MTTEQKAKAYDELLIKAKQIYNKENDVLIMHTIEDLFPELAESEDERIRKELIKVFSNREKYLIDQSFGDITVSEALTWLEKQGEHANFRNKIQIGDKVTRNEDGVLVNLSQLKRVAKKDEKQGEQKPQGKSALEAAKKEKVDNQNCVKPANKVEPKFNNGQWIVWRDKCYKVNYNGCGYELVDQNGLSTSLEYGTIDENAHIWDITKDAKDGDVLEFGDHGRLVVGIVSYINKTTGKVDVNCLLENNNFKVGNYYNLDTIKPHPATKEQRDTLEKAMTDAGYTFDFEKKELKKIIEEKQIKKNLQDNSFRRMFERKSACWSEEDEKTRKKIIKFLKEQNYFDGKANEFKEPYKKEYEWLKSLKDRFTWKPSREQMDALHDAAVYVDKSMFPYPKGILMKLYKQLKKLREE